MIVELALFKNYTTSNAIIDIYVRGKDGSTTTLCFLGEEGKHVLLTCVLSLRILSRRRRILSRGIVLIHAVGKIKDEFVYSISVA